MLQALEITCNPLNTISHGDLFALSVIINRWRCRCVSPGSSVIFIVLNDSVTLNTITKTKIPLEYTLLERRRLHLSWQLISVRFVHSEAFVSQVEQIHKS